ncbi:MAG: hypothetical protein J1E35_08565 [Lachnospiraceae bacterium]|nr:hypothetical protein [Lachnospiraceae bacterium]
MAAEKKKGTSQGRSSSKKSSSSGRRSSGGNNHNESGGPDILTVVIVLVAVVLVIVLLINYNKGKNGDKEPTNVPSGTPSAAATGTPGGNTPGGDTPTGQPTQEPPVPTVGPTATQAPSGGNTTPTPTEKPGFSAKEAENIVRKQIDEAEYTIELLDDHLMIDGVEYYSFCVNDKNGEAMEPLLIVEKTEGTLLCYDFSGVVSQFSKFPLDKTETGSSGMDVISEEQAKTLLLGYSKEALGLAKEVSSYETEVDYWTTIAAGKECYGINLFETVDGKKRFCGTYYVALDGSAVYSKDDVTQDFIER